jgi:hypothetical protein
MNRLHYSGLSALFLSIAALAFCSCNKKDLIQSVSTYTFTNSLESDVTIDIYNNQSDYYNRKNALKTLTIPVGNTLPIEFESVRNYWLDWYTSDFLYNNWATSFDGTASLIGYPPPKLNIASENDNIIISGSNPDMSRSVILNGNDLSSSWRMDITNIPALVGTHLFTFRRDYTGQYTFIGQTGDSTVMPVKMLITQVLGLSFRMDLMADNETRLAEVYYTAPSNWSQNSGRDTILVNFRTPGFNLFNSARRL